MTVIYVCGYGRSGSTLLGRLLAAGRGDGVVGVGEVSNIASAAFLARSECSCGHNYPRCAYWAAVHQRLVELDGGQASLSQRRRRLLEGLPGLLLPLAVLRRLVGSAAFTETYPGVPFDLGVRVLIEAGRGGVVVDISKTTRRTANRPRLLRASGQEVELHIAARPLREVVVSYRAAHARRGAEVGRWRAWATVTVGLCVSILSAHRCARSLGAPLRRTPLSEAISQSGELTSSHARDHMIAGNRSRYLDQGDSA